MSMSTHIVGFIPPDEKWQKMKQVWDSCKEAGIDVPEEVEEFFDWEAPDEQGVEIAEKKLPVKEWSDDMRQGYELDISKLVQAYPDIKVIRFYNSW